MSIEVSIKGLPACAVPPKRTRASLRFDGYARTRASPRRVREGGGGEGRGERHAWGTGDPPMQAAPVDKGRKGNEGPLRFHTTWLTRLLGRGEGGTRRDRVARGSRKSGPRVSRLWGISALRSIIRTRRHPCGRVRTCVCVARISEEPAGSAKGRDDPERWSAVKSKVILAREIDIRAKGISLGRTRIERQPGRVIASFNGISTRDSRSRRRSASTKEEEHTCRVRDSPLTSSLWGLRRTPYGRSPSGHATNRGRVVALRWLVKVPR